MYEHMNLWWALGNSCIKDQGTDIRTVEQTTSPSKLGHTQTKLLSNQPYQPWFNQNLIHRSEGWTWLAENVGFIWIHLDSKCYCGWLRNPASLWMVFAPYQNDGMFITYQLKIFGFRNHPPYVCLLDTFAVVLHGATSWDLQETMDWADVPADGWASQSLSPAEAMAKIFSMI